MLKYVIMMLLNESQGCFDMMECSELIPIGAGTGDPRFDFSDEDIRLAVKQGKLLSAELELTRACNYRCIYCYAAEPGGVDVSNELTFDEICNILDQVAELGARKIILLGGEPLIYPRLKEVLDHIYNKGMVAEIFTNGALVTDKMAEMLASYPVRMIVKLNTMDPELHDRLTGMKGSLDISFRAIERLKNAGYDKLKNMLGATTILATSNLAEAAGMRRWMREQDLLPYFEVITPQGRILENQTMIPPASAVYDTFVKLAEIDREYGIEWDPQPPIAGGKCFRHQYSCVIGSCGVVTPCVGLTAEIGNVRETPLATILSESLILYHLKNYRQFIKGPCAKCDKAEHCYGCRGAAYQVTGDYLASDPTCWRNTDKLDQIKCLPISSKGMLPHDGPMLFVDELLEVGEKSSVSRSVIRKDNPFLHADGTAGREVLVEYAAQTAALMDSLEHDGKVSPGMLVEVQKFNINGAAKVGDEIRVYLKKEYDLDIWHGVSVRIHVNGTEIAEGQLKLCIFDS